jgi:hypothetical protein
MSRLMRPLWIGSLTCYFLGATVAIFVWCNSSMGGSSPTNCGMCCCMAFGQCHPNNQKGGTCPDGGCPTGTGCGCYDMGAEDGGWACDS